MASEDPKVLAGEELVKQDLITREELTQAHQREAQTGTPWYRDLVQRRLLSFGAVEDVLRYEFHPKALRKEHQGIGDELLASGVITEAQLSEALAEQKRNGRLLGNILFERGYVTRAVLAKALARQYEMDFAELEKTPSSADALEAVPESVARKNELIPVSLEGDRLTVLVTGPQNKTRLNSVGILLGKRLVPMLTAADDIKVEIRKRYEGLRNEPVAPATKKPTRAVTGPQAVQTQEPITSTRPKQKETGAVAKIETKPVDMSPGTSDSDTRFEDIARLAAGTSVVKMVSTILEGAVNSSATDIHLDPQEPEMRVRYRIDGVLHDVMSIPEHMQAAVVSRVKILSDLDITETRRPQDGHLSMDVSGREFDVRVATLPTFLGERVVLRLLDQSSILSGIRDLGLEDEDERKLAEMIDEPYGMILVTGPTGSGKTTTLYAALNQKNVLTDSIVTLEDPVEYQLSGINQVQIDPEIGVTFANTLRAALRQDIDVLLVGEIRDQDTARIAIRAAMTGHLVFSTLHTNDAPEAISTLRNMGVPSFLISSAMTGIIAQRLVRTICPECRASFSPNAAMLKSLGIPNTVKKLYRGKGCANCYNTGNRGRTGIFEVLDITPAVRKAIAEDKSTDDIAKMAKLKTMSMRCRQKVKDGRVAPEEFLRVVRT